MTDKPTLAEIDDNYDEGHWEDCDIAMNASDICSCGHKAVKHLRQVIEGLIEHHKAYVRWREAFAVYKRRRTSTNENISIAVWDQAQAAKAALPPDVKERLG